MPAEAAIDNGRKRHEEELRRQIDAYRGSALILTAAKLGIADRMGAGVWQADALADAMVLSREHVFRFLRALAVIGICEELPERKFALTEMGLALRSDSPSGLAERALLAAEQYWQAWGELAFSVRTGEPAFAHVFGTDVWAWRRANSTQGAAFQAWTAKACALQAVEIVETLDFAGVSTVADVGGGSGALLAAILRARPDMRGILLDHAQVIDGAKPLLRDFGVAERVQCVAGDLLAPMTIIADLYVVKHVLHDFGDDDVRAILRNCRACVPDDARLLVIEDVLPEQARDDPAAILLDMHMMAVTGGRERTTGELTELLSRSGFEVFARRQTASGLWLIEATPA